MSNSTLLIIGAAVVLLALVLFLLARTGRKSVQDPADGIALVRPATELSPVATDEPLPEPGSLSAPALATAELAPEPTPPAPEPGPPQPVRPIRLPG